MDDLFGDAKSIKRRGVIIRDLPPIPNTGWKAPSDPPNLDSAVIMGFDVETKEYDSLTEFGPGWGRGRGHIIGASLAVEDRHGNRGAWYFPVKHELEAQDNLDPGLVFPWLKQQLARPIPKVGANILYDCGYLAFEGMPVAGPLHDIQFAEAILDNNARVSLDTLAKKYLGHGKITDVVETWIMEAYNSKPVSSWRKELWRTPPRLVGPYAEGDAWEPLVIIKKQWETIARENLGTIYDLEHGLIPMLVGMRMNGVRVDVEKAMLLKDELGDLVEAEYLAIERDYGMLLDSTDTRQIAKLFDKEGIKYPRTEAGGPSIQKPWLEALEHPLGDRINDLREMEKMIGTFLQSYLIEKNVKGRVYPQFHPLKGDSGGTMLGRFASSTPNFQNIPSRTELGGEVRSLVIPEQGHVAWHKKDYSQLHYRILADLAVDRGDGSADRLRQSYIDDPKMDYHMKVYKSAAPLLGWNTDYTLVPDKKGKMGYNSDIVIRRRPIKNINFGLIYGQGEPALAYKAGFTGPNAKILFNAYHAAAPYVKPTMEAIAFEAERAEYVTTLLGRRIRFEKWEPRERHSRDVIPLPRTAALAQWGSMIRLAFLYRAVNYKIQGTEPDIMKTAMLQCYRSGVFDVTGLPMLTVHDELNWSKRDHSAIQNEAFDFINHTMETATLLRVPLVVDAKEAEDWGACG